MLEAAIIGSGRSMPGLFSMRRRILRLRRFNWRWTLAFTRKPPEGEQASAVKHLDCSRKPGGFRVFRPQKTWDYAWLRSSRALAGRFLVLHMTESFAGREDRALEPRLHAELPSVLNWSILGWKRLRARGKFVQPESGRPLVEELTELSSRITTFLADACEIDPSYQEAIPHVYEARSEE